MPKRVLKGTVVSVKGDKTAIVDVTRTVMHKRFHKTIKRSKRYAAHDQENKCQLGDTVSIVESTPISKTKRWRVVEA